MIINTAHERQKREAERVKTLEEIKQLAIQKLNDTYDKQVNGFEAKYSKREIATFPTKQKEAELYEADTTVATPRLSDMVGGNEEKRVGLVTAILGNVRQISQLEGQMVGRRGYIKSLSTIIEIEKAMESFEL